VRIYLAADKPNTMPPVRAAGYPWLLASFAFPQTMGYGTRVDPLAGHPLRSLILDSGAFTAWTKGKRIELGDYRRFAAWCRDRWPELWAGGELHFVNLDVIPGVYGRASTAPERATGMAASLANADALRADGLRVMEVYHQDEPPDFLAALVARRRPGELLGLSPRNDLTPAARVTWVRQVYGAWQRAGTPIPPCHLLGATMRAIWETCPIYSADSITWINPQKFGTYAGRDGKHVALDGQYPSSRPRAVRALGFAEGIANYRRISDDWTRVWARRGFAWDGPPEGGQFIAPGGNTSEQA
jgi:hypothetical protein